MNKKDRDRLHRLIPGGIPRYVRIYDHGEESTIVDRYTVVFTRVSAFLGNEDKAAGYPRAHARYPYLSMDERPRHPQGFCQHGESDDGPIDYPRYSHLGRKIEYKDLPEPCQDAVLDDYLSYWSLDEVYTDWLCERMDVSTILAALRLYQGVVFHSMPDDEGGYHVSKYEVESMLSIASDGGKLDSLSSLGITNLRMELNTSTHPWRR